MQKAVWLLIGAGLLVGKLPATTIQFDVTSLGSNEYSYSYGVSDVTLQANQELDIEFDPHLYGSLSSGVAPSGFSLLLFEPNQPLGALGDYSALAVLNNPSLAGTFSVDFSFIGSGQPGAQAFFINQYDQFGNFKGTIESGTTTDLSVASAVPEPGGFSLCLLGFLAVPIWCTVRRRFHRTA